MMKICAEIEADPNEGPPSRPMPYRARPDDTRHPGGDHSLGRSVVDSVARYSVTPARWSSTILVSSAAAHARPHRSSAIGGRALKAHRQVVVDPAITNHRGRIVKTTGDGMLVEFASAVDAVRCAVDVQRGMAERNEAVPPERRIHF